GSVNGCVSPPAVGTTETSVFPAMVAVKAIFDPSGEKYGSISAPWVEVSRRAGPPLRGTTHKSPAYSKATESRLTVGWRKSRVPCADAATEITRLSSSVKSSSRMFIVLSIVHHPWPGEFPAYNEQLATDNGLL